MPVGVLPPGKFRLERWQMPGSPILSGSMEGLVSTLRNETDSCTSNLRVLSLLRGLGRLARHTLGRCHVPT